MELSISGVFVFGNELFLKRKRGRFCKYVIGDLFLVGVLSVGIIEFLFFVFVKKIVVLYIFFLDKLEKRGRG